jgi:hypothetical protein
VSKRRPRRRVPLPEDYGLESKPKPPRIVHVMDEDAAIAWAGRADAEDRPDVIRVKVKDPYKLARNKTERAYMEHLEQLRIAGEIADWRYEDITFRLGHDCRCTWDFCVIHNDGRMEFRDTKGHVEDVARVKARTFRRMYPWFPLTFVFKRGNGWECRPMR